MRDNGILQYAFGPLWEDNGRKLNIVDIACEEKKIQDNFANRSPFKNDRAENAAKIFEILQEARNEVIQAHHVAYDAPNQKKRTCLYPRISHRNLSNRLYAY